METSNESVVWEVIGTKERGGTEKYLIGYINSVDKRTKNSAIELGTKLCIRNGYYFLELREKENG